MNSQQTAQPAHEHLHKPKVTRMGNSPGPTKPLCDLLDHAAERFPKNTAIEECDGASIRYGELADLSNRLSNRLRRLGVQSGDRVGLCLPKSADAVASMFGIMKAGAAYVPVDPSAPAVRSAYILQNCAVKAVIVEAPLAGPLKSALDANGFSPVLLVLEAPGAGAALRNLLDQLDAADPAPADFRCNIDSAQLAYILYTSGSTGRPKGVALSHANAASFVDWCSEVFMPNERDRFSSHAPFHFDLSILDIYVSLKHGAAMVIVAEQSGKDPIRLAPWIAERKITIWYSAPSILSLMAQFGKMDQQDYSALRMVLFAGEVFPIKYLRLLKSLVSPPRYFNLYGPTETNVCTWYEVPRLIPDSQTEPMPIGKACSHCRALVVDEAGDAVRQGDLGELCIAGPSVLEEYWGLPEQTNRAFLSGRDERWYRTGDLVIEQPDESFRFAGRRDRMIKKRGHRIELGEIEAALYTHPKIKEAAVIATPDDEGGVRVNAWVSTRTGERLSIIELKKHCADILPLYMVPDQFRCLESLPKTSTDKIDYQRLKELS